MIHCSGTDTCSCVACEFLHEAYPRKYPRSKKKNDNANLPKGAPDGGLGDTAADAASRGARGKDDPE